MTLASTKKSIAMKESWARRKKEGKVKSTKRKKGKWSKIARAKHSVRMKERWAKKYAVAIPDGQKLSIADRLDLIEGHVQSIRKQMGGGSNGRAVL